MTLARVRLALFALCLGTALCTGGVAHAAASGWVGDKHAAVRLIASADDVAGTTLDAGLEFRFAHGWHGYWRTPGDAGVAPQFDWSRSDNVAGADVAWPAPHRLVGPAEHRLRGSVRPPDQIPHQESRRRPDRGWRELRGVLGRLRALSGQPHLGLAARRWNACGGGAPH